MTRIALPDPPQPVGAYAACVIRNGIGFVSGQFPLADGALIHKGRIGAELSIDEGRNACRQAALNVLAQIAAVTDDFETLAGLLRIDGYIASAEGFVQQPTVLDAASALFVETLSEKGVHARSAIAVPWLPLNSPVELVATFATPSAQTTNPLNSRAR